MPQKNKGTSPPECLVVVVVDGTFRLENHSETIFKAYLESILKHLKSPYVEDKERKEKIWPNLRCGLVTFGHYEPYSPIPVKSHYFESLSQFEELITGIEFANGGMYENAVAEGLVSALEMFDLHTSQMESDAPQPKRHCVLISNSHPCPDPVHRNISSKYDDYTIEQVAEEMHKQSIYLSLITPEKGFDELENLVEMVNRNIEVHDAPDVIDSSHVVKLANFKVPFSQPTEVMAEKKRKREDSTPISDSHTSEQPTSTSSASSSPESKKVKLENVDEQSREQVQSVSASRPSEVASDTKKQVSSPVLPVQQPPSNPSGSKSQVSSPKVPRSSPVVSNVAPASAISTVTVNQIQQQQQSPMKVPQQIPQQTVSAQLANSLSSAVGGARPVPQNVLHFMNAQQLIQKNKLLQHELLASQQNLVDVLRRQQFVNSGGIGPSYTTTTSPIGTDTQSLNSYATSPSLGSVVNAQNIGGFNPSGSSSQPVLAFPPTTLNARIPTTSATVGMSSLSAAPNGIITTNPAVNSSIGINNVTSSAASAAGVNANQIRPNIPKTLNALWSGYIAWATGGQQNGFKRELTCHVTAFPHPNRRTGPSSLNDYMTHVWPEKMEISSINHAKDFIKDAGNNPKLHVVSFLPTPSSAASTDNQNTFTVLMRILESKKLAAFARFPNAPNSNGGVVLFTNGPKLVGLLFLDSPLPTSLTSQQQLLQSTILQQQQALQALQQQLQQQPGLQQMLQQRRVNPQMQVARLPTQQTPQTMAQQQMMLQRQMHLSSLFQTASSSNPRMDGQDLVHYVKQQRQQTQQQQQPTQ
ncbi:5260_t:CDS:10 [Acaulospora morrowiae]|uniref:Mediator of RNA polymerase II transcription subunit 25 n=1 Tax=Acaulospora morrowiae TaxID=94023 RepID=A0A9N9BF96_9GLOM|nr:5260_t:CDS:10 [Acaulospora morrowiae]